MKMKTQLSLGSIIAAGLLASGCSQMSGQMAQATPETAAPAPAPEVRTIVDCSKCAPVAKPRPAAKKPAPRARPRPVAKKPAPARRAPPTVRRAPPAVRRAPAVNRWAHTHPAIPGCTNSITHSHQYNRANHTHRYSCRQGQRPAARQQVRQQARPAVNRWAHTHPAVPGCTNSITHSHPYNNANHSHRYSCRGNFRPQPRPQYRQPQYRQPAMPAMPVMPKVKAKGTYRGPIQIDGGVMQQYQQ